MGYNDRYYSNRLRGKCIIIGRQQALVLQLVIQKLIESCCERDLRVARKDADKSSGLG